MSEILIHCETSKKKFGGKIEDYLEIHQFLDSSKTYIADWRHRSLFHSTLGIELCIKIFGQWIERKSDAVKVDVRAIASLHIIEDMGCIPEPSWYLREMPLRYWFGGNLSTNQRDRLRKLSIEEIVKE